MIYVLYFLHIMVSLFLILVVLLQQGKGADLSVFGGGASQAAFGARGTATLLHKLTVIGFVVFIFTTISIGLMQSRTAPSVMSGVATETAIEEPATTEPAAAVTGSDTATDSQGSETEPATTDPGLANRELEATGENDGDQP